jgi:hypothetical protein
MELFITVATFLVAIYAVASRERQLDLKLRFSSLDVWVIGLGFAAALYFEFYDFAEYHGLAVTRDRWPRGLTPQNATYLVILFLIAWLYYRIRTARFSPKNIFEFQELADELFWARRFGELMSLLEAHSQDLFKAAQADFPLVRLRKRLNPRPQYSFEALLALKSPDGDQSVEPKGKQRWFSRLRNRVAGRASKLLPDYETESSAAQDIIRSVLLARPFLKALASSRPYAALHVLSNWPSAFDRLEFVHRYLRELIENDASILYTEIEHNQNISSSSAYVIPRSNRILHFFLSDANLAHDYRVYKPLGDFAEWHLDRLARRPDEDPYNNAMGPFDQEEALRWPMYAVIRFFDIMVTQALYQGVQWHMWLYYFPPIVQRIVRNYRVDDPLAEPEAEYPVRYAYLLSEMFRAMRDWILALEYIPETQSNTVLEKTAVVHENNNIPKSSILALTTCLRHALESDHFGERLKHSLADSTIGVYFELRGIGRDRYATMFAAALLRGGLGYSRDDSRYLRELYRSFEQEEDEYRIKHDEGWVDDLRAVLTT